MKSACKQNRETQPELFEVVTGFEELNLVEAPLAVLSKQRPRGVRTLRFQDSIRDKLRNEDVERKWVISVIEELPSVPTAIHMDVLLALFRIASSHPGVAEVPFTLYQVCKELQWPVDGRSYERIKDSLRQWTGTIIRFENAFRRGNRWASEKGFNIVCWYELTRGEDFDPDQPHRVQHFVWNPKILDSVQAQHIKPLDWSFYCSLQSAPSKRLYRLLDKRFHNTDFYMPRMGFVDFCREKIGMSRSYKKAAKYRERIQPAFDELTGKGYLSSVRIVEQRGVQKVEFRRARKKTGRASIAQRDKPVMASVADNISPLAKELIARGMTQATAVRWVDTQADECARQVEYFDFRCSTGWKPEQSSGGYLNKAIQDRFGPPDGFKSRDQRDKEQAERVKQTRLREQATAEKEAKRLAAEEKEARAFHEFLNSLGSDEERVEFEREAVGRSFHRERYKQAEEEGGEDFKFWRDAVLKEHWKRQQLEKRKT